MKQKAICIDFDGVIHRYSKGWQDGSIYDPPMEGARDQMEKMVKNGYKLVIFTTRLNPEVNEDTNLEKNKMTKWLSENGFELNKHYHDITAVKPNALVYIDDRALRFTNWTDISKYFS